ncbi:histidine kinase [Flavobacteriaceae bacterium S0825]|uniref:sensor histidine kinase n=1 Tax=Gaetbulibacter sp. S0825 TaxID=2720084 RepID=UPI001431328D|nr:histidine kinase [Gaetbulibacter sp. S0825]MCK0109750.1 histidine kinase [Flavobacteriaceae bacterium S0825]NIX65382.1 histidine kinase [Gaetbulibacter sp. S0825]
MTTKTFKIVFHILYFATLIGVFMFGGYEYDLDTFLSKDFYSRDIFEILLVTTLTYFFYYKCYVKKTLVGSKIIWLLLCVFLLTVVAINKKYTSVVPNGVNVLITLFQYIGFGAVLFFFLWTLDNAKFLKNERFFSTKKALKEAESKLLRQQFNPHFLFNAFNSLYSLSLQNHPKTPDTILKLSNMMRYLTDDSIQSKVKLTQELNFIETYISVEKIRFGNDANINLEIDGHPEDYNIEPLLLIPLVENAFKHGFYTNDADAFININVNVSNNLLIFKVENSIQKQQHFNTIDREGKGLNNLKKRLQLSYPKKHDLVTQNKDNVYLAELNINLS